MDLSKVIEDTTNDLQKVVNQEFQLEAIFSLSKFEDSAMFAFGNDNNILIKSPTDMKHFYDVTENNYLIMGRKTFESMGSQGLDNRKFVVVSSMDNKDFKEQMNCFLVRSLRDAIKFCKNEGANKAIVIGGTELINEALPLVNTVYYTLFNYKFKFEDIDTPYFPKLLFNKHLLTTTKCLKVREKCDIIPTGETKTIKFQIQTLKRK